MVPKFIQNLFNLLMSKAMKSKFPCILLDESCCLYMFNEKLFELLISQPVNDKTSDIRVIFVLTSLQFWAPNSPA